LFTKNYFTSAKIRNEIVLEIDGITWQL